MSSLVIVLTTVSSEADALSFGRALIEEGLAACVNVGPRMTSVYRWKGSIEQAGEHQMVIKTTHARLAALEARMRDLHPYEVPEFLVLEGKASAAYAGWAEEATSGQEPA